MQKNKKIKNCQATILQSNSPFNNQSLPHILASRFSESDKARPMPIFSGTDSCNALEKFSTIPSLTSVFLSDSQNMVLKFGWSMRYLKTEARTRSSATFFMSVL